MAKMGKPLMYENVEEMQKKIDEYFKYCEGEPMIAEDGAPVFNRYGTPIVLNSHPPTITGLALWLGFNSRQALINYQVKDEFHDTITRAKARVEQYCEERLFDRDGTQGAQFSLRNNFKGWKEDSADENKLQLLDSVLEKIGGVI